MKLNKWLCGVMGLAMLASCSDNDLKPSSGSDIENGDNGGSTTSGYLAVQLNLPQQSSTRATPEYDGSNDQYDDGETWEYNVSNALIVLFTGKADADAAKAGYYIPAKTDEITFLRAQELVKPFFWNEDANDNITTSYLAAIEVVNKNFSDNLWAVVMLNRDKTKFAYDKGTNEFKIKDTKITTYKQLLAAISEETDDSDFLTQDETTGEKRIFMTNAPLSNKAGGKTGIAADLANPYIETLAHLGTKDNLYDNMETAKANPAACIFVERALAKVTYGKTADDAIQLTFVNRVQQKDDSGNVVVDSDGNPVYIDQDMDLKADLTVSSSVKYCLTNKNKKSYIIRNVDFPAGDHFQWDLTYDQDILKTDYRMIGDVGMPALKSPFHQEKKSLFRTYWCMDPNYGEAMPEGDKIEYDPKKDFQPVNAALYAKENTFTVQHQAHGNTTLAVFEVNLNISKKIAGDVGTENQNLYIRDDNKEKVYVTPEEAMAPVFLRVYNDNDIKTALKSLAKPNVTGTYKVSDYIKIDWVVSASDKKITWTDIRAEVKAGGDTFFPAEVEVAKADGSGTETVTFAEAFKRLIGDNSSTSAIKTKFNLLGDLNNWYDVTEYTGGISYYVVPIQHFGDKYCPWDGTGTKTDVTYKYTDADHAHKWLGRYGMVRNNWYELNINKIQALGSAVPPEIVDDLSDDFKEEKKYFAVEIHTLSWARRVQNIEFE